MPHQVCENLWLCTAPLLTCTKHLPAYLSSSKNVSTIRCMVGFSNTGVIQFIHVWTRQGFPCIWGGATCPNWNTSWCIRMVNLVSATLGPTPQVTGTGPLGFLCRRIRIIFGDCYWWISEWKQISQSHTLPGIYLLK